MGNSALIFRRVPPLQPPTPTPLPQYKQPKMEIKKDPKGVVTVPGATMVQVTSSRELMDTIEGGQRRRHVSSTAVSPARPRAAAAHAAGFRSTECSPTCLHACGQPLDGCLPAAVDPPLVPPVGLELWANTARPPHSPPLPSPPPCTQMNRESSRSHLIITVCIEATNLQTQNVSHGKLSFVDLAGSER